ncbi:RNA polymerase sigma factor [Telluribacter sp. SYSU D00476]|uniref:RNA polymerase sigma factor n=1 Tax=Telluribacter sp. SYSU D00476 TaxID=2811430 RepID=UPI001FF4CC83|nr:sigma-70 family RNA polymerase sigma factor [Telluribacter sp. SYSU D00476]
MSPRFTKITDDAVLWSYFREGDEEAYTELARRYYRTLLQYGQKFTPNVQLIEDALQDLLVHLWLHRETINDTPSVRFYLLKSFRHRILKTIKPRTEEVELTGRFDDLVPEFSREDSLIQVESDQALQKQMQGVLDQLPSRQQEVIYLRFFQNLKPEEIAGLLSINPQSVSNIIQRALGNLRELWPSTLPYMIAVCSFCQIV